MDALIQREFKKAEQALSNQQVGRKELVFEYIKNVWIVRKPFIDNFSVDPPVINMGDATPCK